MLQRPLPAPAACYPATSLLFLLFICARSDHDSDDDQPKKPVPEWARGERLRAQLIAQVGCKAPVRIARRLPQLCCRLHRCQLSCTRLTPAPARLLSLVAAPQTKVDPDEIFQQHQKTCSLDEVFANGEAKPGRPLSTRARPILHRACMRQLAALTGMWHLRAR